MEECHCKFTDTNIWAQTCPLPFMLTLETLFQVTNSVSDSCNRLEPLNAAGSVADIADEYDFIVVGAGVAGGVVTGRLVEVAQWKVLLVEAGPLEPTITNVPYFVGPIVNSSLDWGIYTEPEPKACANNGGRCWWPRGKTVGGTSVFNDMMQARGHPDDYNLWPADDNINWNFDNDLPYFKKFEHNSDHSFDSDYHGFDGPLPVSRFTSHPPLVDSVLEASTEVGYFFNEDISEGSHVTGFTIAQFSIRNGTRYSTARAYLRSCRDRENFDLLVNALATKVVIDSGTKTATGVDITYTDGDGVQRTKTVNAAKEVILSGGSVNSAQLLLLSGIGPQSDLEDLGIEVIQDLPVGQKLENHVGAKVYFTINDTFKAELNDESVQEYINDLSGPVSTNGITQLTAFISSSLADKGHADLQLFIDGYDTGCPTRCVEGTEPGCERRPLIIRPTMLTPRSKGSVSLRSTDPFDTPLVYGNYFSNDTDLVILKEGVQFVLKLAQTDALSAWDFQVDRTAVPECADIEDDDAYWECVIATDTSAENHQCCTAKMGVEGDPDSVVDLQLRVKGVNNLRVIDFSVAPFVPRANPIPAIIMIAERGADFIKQTYNISSADVTPCSA